MQKKTLTSVITGDIVSSRTASNAHWLPALNKALSYEGKSPETWQVYRGDSFQVEVRDPATALLAAIRIKAAVKAVDRIDVRMAIGIGEKKYASKNVVESDGEAFVRSGEKFESLKKLRQTLAIKSPWPDLDRSMNVCFRLACIPMDSWSPGSAQLVLMLVTQENLTQKTIAGQLGVTQPSVSERQNRSHYDEIMDLEKLYREKIAALIP